MSIYGILIGIGIIIGLELILRNNKQYKYKDILLTLLITLIGARVLFILHNIQEVKENIINPFAIWDGGLAFFGALIGLLLSLYVISKYKKESFLKISDSVLLFLPLIQSLGRIGNYFNYELYGKPTSLPWAIYIPREYRDPLYLQSTHFHPVFIYESVLNILNFLLLFYLKKKDVKRGYITAIYLVNYSLIRIFMNMIRIDKEYIFNIETSNLFSIIFLLSGILIILNIKRFNKDKYAHFFSRTVTLSLIGIAVISVLLNTHFSLKLNIVLGFLSFVIPISTIIGFKYLGITSDFNVTKREERPKLFLVMAICFVLALYISIVSSREMLIVIYTVLNLTFFLGFLITLVWKISFHMIWNILAIFIIIYTWQIPYLYILTILIPFIGWSRIQLKRHSLKQVIVGAFLTIFCIFIVLTFMKF